MIMDMIKVAVIGTIGSLLALALKSAKGEFATYINLSACVLIMLYLAARLSGIVSQLEFMTEYVDIDSDYILIMLKMAGLTYRYAGIWDIRLWRCRLRILESSHFYS